MSREMNERREKKCAQIYVLCDPIYTSTHSTIATESRQERKTHECFLVSDMNDNDDQTNNNKIFNEHLREIYFHKIVVSIFFFVSSFFHFGDSFSSGDAQQRPKTKHIVCVHSLSAALLAFMRCHGIRYREQIQ